MVSLSLEETYKSQQREARAEEESFVLSSMLSTSAKLPPDFQNVVYSTMLRLASMEMTKVARRERGKGSVEVTTRSRTRMRSVRRTMYLLDLCQSNGSIKHVARASFLNSSRSRCPRDLPPPLALVANMKTSSVPVPMVVLHNNNDLAASQPSSSSSTRFPP